MSTCENELVTVCVRNSILKGVHYSTDPEAGWVSVLLPGTPVRLVLVRPDVVKFSGKPSPDLLALRIAESHEAQDSIQSTLKATNIVAGFERRSMEAQVVGCSVHLLDGAVKILPPFRDHDIHSNNETILARITQLLREIRKESFDADCTEEHPGA